MTAEPSEGTTSILPPGTAEENSFVLKYGPNLLDELEGLVQSKRLYDMVIVTAANTGFLFPAEILLEAAHQARRLLALQGGLIIADASRAVAVVRESLMGGLSFHVFDSLAELYDYSPTFAHQVELALGKSVAGTEESTDLSQQVLMSAVPVLTPFGIKLKAGMESQRIRNLLLTAVDNYTPLSAIVHRVSGKAQISLEEILEELRSLEQIKAIYPLFPKVPFLVHCFRNQIPFNLRDYLIAAKLVSQDQLDEMTFEQQSTRGKERQSLGPLSVTKGYLSTRQFEIALQDLAFYGQAREVDKVKLVSSTGEQPLVQSLIGHLGTTDPAGLLQNLASNRESGVLSVENRDWQFRALFDQGRLANAKLGRLKGDTAIVEFVSCWREGIFVFIQRQPPPDLAHDSCRITRNLDKLLLDAALAQDNIEVVWKKLPKGANSPLEKLPDSGNVFQSGKIMDPQEKRQLSAREIEVMKNLWQALDGLTPLVSTIKNLGDPTTVEAAAAVDRLLSYQLVSIPAMDVTGPMDKFRQIVAAVSAKIGVERNLALLRLSLQATQGYSVRARMFTIGAQAEVGLDLAAARSAGTSLSMVLKDLDDWLVKYIEYVSQELDKNVLRDIVFAAHQHK